VFGGEILVGEQDIKILVENFKSSMIRVSEILGIPPHSILRNQYRDVCKDNGVILRLNSDGLDALGGFRNAKDTYFQKAEEVSGDTQLPDLIYKFKKFLSDTQKVPTFKEFEDATGISTSSVKKYFDSIESLYNHVISESPELSEVVLNETHFTKSYFDRLEENIKNYKRFIITTAVNNKKVRRDFLNSLNSYAKINNALVLVLPCQDVANRRSVFEWNLDPILHNCSVVFKDTYLNSNIFISDIKVSAKMLLPTTGLSRLAQGKGSMIVASPKQFLEYVPSSNNKLPIAVMTTGAITEEDYSSDLYMSLRLAKLAEHDHTVGAIVVELQDNKIFHFRQIQASESGSFTDLGTVYKPDGTCEVSEDVVVVFGDSHVSIKEDAVHSVVKDIVTSFNVEDVVVQDIADNECISHHIQNKFVTRAMNSLEGIGSIEKEGTEIVEYINEVASWISGKVIVLRSNHDAFLDRYLEDGRFVKDETNFYYCLDICKAMMEGDNPLRFMIEDKIGLANYVSILWLDYDDDYKVYGSRIAHGHLGANGSKGSAKNLEKCYGKAWLGHSHTPCIWRGVYQVGTLSKLKLKYNKGVSSWVHTCGLAYKDGSRQLINIIGNPDGKYTWRI
jgi:hypothetical protein